MKPIQRIETITGTLKLNASKTKQSNENHKNIGAVRASMPAVDVVLAADCHLIHRIRMKFFFFFLVISGACMELTNLKASKDFWKINTVNKLLKTF